MTESKVTINKDDPTAFDAVFCYDPEEIKTDKSIEEIEELLNKELKEVIKQSEKKRWSNEGLKIIKDAMTPLFDEDNIAEVAKKMGCFEKE